MKSKTGYIEGALLGTAVGDSLGLPYEGLSKKRAKKLLGLPSRHRLILNYGMISDDTEHSCMVAQALIASGGNVEAFQRKLAGLMRFWLLALPAGIGFATLRAIIILWFGVHPSKSGVYSAGNGPAMRTAIIGAAIDDIELLKKLVKATTRITHTDPKAEWGAYAVALAAYFSKNQKNILSDEYLSFLGRHLGGEAREFMDLVEHAVNSVKSGESTQKYAESQGFTKGISGYVYHTVPIALHAWLSYPDDYKNAITSVIECGGDTDTVAAIVGGIVGSSVGKKGIPKKWLANLHDWPRSVSWMEALAKQLEQVISSGARKSPMKTYYIFALLRNLFFIPVVLIHGFRRLFPPY